MNYSFENLSKFFEKVKSITFLQRLFNWTSVRSLSYDAHEEYKRLLAELNKTTQELSVLRNDVAIYKKDIESIASLKHENKEIPDLKSNLSSANTKVQTLQQQITKLEETTIPLLNQKIIDLNAEITNFTKENTIFKQTEDSRKTTYENNVANLNALRERLEKNELQRQKDRENEIAADFQLMKETWASHEVNVETTIKNICKRYFIEYIDKEKIPFKGKPDNTIKVCDEYIIFDAKSPASDDLENFPKYIIQQTDSVKKYIKEEGVKKDIYLIIPSNTLHVIKQFSYNMGDYNVFIISTDALEPIILSLKKIEEYEFAEQLSPDERDNICRIIGKFAHATKRRIQIDSFFTQEFLSLLSKCKTDLPKDILEKVIEFEKSEKINPPVEKRAKQILTSDLEKENKKNQIEAEAKDIIFPVELENIKKIPLTPNDSTD